MKSRLYRLILSFLIASCSGTNNRNLHDSELTDTKKIIQIDPRTFKSNNLKISDFADDISYLKLSNKILVGNIIDLQLTDQGIYVVVDNSTGGEGNGHQEMIRFDKNGNNPVTIGCNGKGPGEYLSCTNFTVDESNNRIYINGGVNTVQVYNTSGEFIRTFQFSDPGIRYGQMQLLNTKYILISKNSVGANIDFLWTIADTLGNVVSRKRNYVQPFETQIGARGGTYCYNGHVSSWVDYNDTIFTIYPDFSYRPKFIIAPGEHRIPHTRFHLSIDLPVRLLEYYSPHSFIETQSYLISRYNYKGEFSYMFLNKKTHKTNSCSFEWVKDMKQGIPNDLDNGFAFSPDAYFTVNNSEYLASIVQPILLKSVIESDAFKTSTPKHPKKKNELKQLANSLNENDNPVLMLVKL